MTSRRGRRIAGSTAAAVIAIGVAVAAYGGDDTETTSTGAGDTSDSGAPEPASTAGSDGAATTTPLSTAGPSPESTTASSPDTSSPEDSSAGDSSPESTAAPSESLEATTTEDLTPGWDPEFAEWDGALDYYERNGFTNSFGDQGDDFFPIAWFGDLGGDPENLAGHAEIGFNTIVAVDTDPAELANITAAGLHAIVAPQSPLTELGPEELETVKAWYVLDEPDNARDGSQECLPPDELAPMTQRVLERDDSRPRMVIFGDGFGVGPPVTDNAWYIGRGRCLGRDEHYRQYIVAEEFQESNPGAGVDIVSWDHYGLGQTGGNPVARTLEGGNEDAKVVGPDALHSIPEGRARAYGLVPELRTQPFWQVLEAIPFTGEYGLMPTSSQLRYHAWSSIIAGATGIVWWDLQMRPQFRATMLIGDESRAQAMSRLNAEIHQLAPVINGSPPVTNGVTVESDLAPISTMVKVDGDTRYVFAASMRNVGPTTATFTLPGIEQGTVEVLGEGGRTLEVVDGRFTDTFGGYRVHLYEITPG
jgi:hypothetical protein